MISNAIRHLCATRTTGEAITTVARARRRCRPISKMHRSIRRGEHAVSVLTLGDRAGRKAVGDHRASCAAASGSEPAVQVGEVKYRG